MTKSTRRVVWMGFSSTVNPTSCSHTVTAMSKGWERAWRTNTRSGRWGSVGLSWRAISGGRGWVRSWWRSYRWVSWVSRRNGSRSIDSQVTSTLGEILCPDHEHSLSSATLSSSSQASTSPVLSDYSSFTVTAHTPMGQAFTLIISLDPYLIYKSINTIPEWITFLK